VDKRAKVDKLLDNCDVLALNLKNSGKDFLPINSDISEMNEDQQFGI